MLWTLQFSIMMPSFFINPVTPNRGQTILTVQPRFGYIAFNGRLTRWLPLEKKRVSTAEDAIARFPPHKQSALARVYNAITNLPQLG